MKEIHLTKGFIALVDDEDFEKVNALKWYPAKGKNTFYATSYDKSVKPQKDLRMHWLVFGKPPKGQVIDHIDGNGLNNQKVNLRIGSYSQNGANRKAWGTSKYLGVRLCTERKKPVWEARMAGKYLGLFSTEEEAALAYNTAAKLFHVEFAKLNVIPDAFT